MKRRLIPAFACVAVTVSCADDLTGAERAIDELVQRFDVPDCEDAALVRGGRNPDKSKPGSEWVYVASDDCIADMERALAEIGFDAIGGSTYRYTSDAGWYELVHLAEANEGSGFEIIWETVDP